LNFIDTGVRRNARPSMITRRCDVTGHILQKSYNLFFFCKRKSYNLCYNVTNLRLGGGAKNTNDEQSNEGIAQGDIILHCLEWFDLFLFGTKNYYLLMSFFIYY
jgi:hypothetical protein